MPGSHQHFRANLLVSSKMHRDLSSLLFPYSSLYTTAGNKLLNPVIPSTLLIRKLTQGWWHLLIAFPFTVLCHFHVKKGFLCQHSLLHNSWAGWRRKIILLLLHTSPLADRYQRIWNENYVFCMHQQQISEITIWHFILFGFLYKHFSEIPHKNGTEHFGEKKKKKTKQLKYSRLYFLRHKNKLRRISNAVVLWRIQYLTGFCLSLENGRNLMRLF